MDGAVYGVPVMIYWLAILLVLLCCGFLVMVCVCCIREVYEYVRNCVVNYRRIPDRV